MRIQLGKIEGAPCMTLKLKPEWKASQVMRYVTAITPIPMKAGCFEKTVRGHPETR
ncbi:protein of unknown function [Georgfuchsia toluolica]|uniref:Uncharacterized protein n=1 Tax=Georgfuchsia toluolica TaxID=424218 RepID=A0A916MZB5_9PROT|nr:protein of unknown function [Georgfuchsia toluolica]